MLRMLPVFIVLGLMVYSLLDVLTTDRSRLRSLSKPVWVLVVLLPVIGAVLWLTVGKVRRSPGAGDSTIHLRRRERTVAPDDDPEFLRQLDERAWRARRDAQRRTQAGQAPQGPQPPPLPQPEDSSGTTPGDEAPPESRAG